MSRPLLHKDGTPAKVGDKITSFRDEPYILAGWPNNGRNAVWVRSPDEPADAQTREYYPSVFDLKWGDR